MPKTGNLFLSNFSVPWEIVVWRLADNVTVEPAKLLLVIAQEICRLLALSRLEVRLPEQENSQNELKTYTSIS